MCRAGSEQFPCKERAGTGCRAAGSSGDSFQNINERINMDIDLLSKMVRELLLDNDKVTLPGLGAFVAENAPAQFSDKGYTVNPPYRKLYFRENQEYDTSLAHLYAVSNGIEEDVAGKIVLSFVSEMKEVLNRDKVIIFPGLGRLRATKENNYFFIADEDMDIYPEGFGLESVSLKAHVYDGKTEGTADAGGTAITDRNKNVTEKPAEEKRVLPSEKETLETERAAREAEKKVYDTGKAEETAIAAGAGMEACETDRTRKTVRKLAIALLAVIGTALLLLGVFVLLARICPDFIDSLLYSKEELEILNY